MNLLDRNFMLTHSQKQYGLPGRENSVRRSVLTCFFLLYFVVRTSLGKQLSPLRGPIASRGGPYQYFQETYPHLEFSGGGGGGSGPPVPTLDQPMSKCHGIYEYICRRLIIR